MKRKPTFFNSRNERLFWDYTDTNNWLFTINYKQGEIHREQNYILRYLKKDNINYISCRYAMKQGIVLVVKKKERDSYFINFIKIPLH